VGSGHTLGERGGEETHTVTISEFPQHSHLVNGTGNNGSFVVGANNFLATTPNKAYHAPTNLTSLSSSTIGPSGGSQAHQNMQPYLVMTFCIALQGIFPSFN
jgi:microcystin-dependent protein